MMVAEFITPLWCLAMVQALGLACAWVARKNEGTHRQTTCHCAFFVCLIMAGWGTAAAFFMGPAPFLFAGAALAITILTATWEVRDAAGAATH